MPDDTKSHDNLGRLLKHLEDGSLAARLVHAHRDSRASDPSESMKAVLRARLDEVRGDLDDTTA
jgi:hypothetical protein